MPKIWVNKKFKMCLIKVNRDKDPEINKYSIFMLGKYNFVLSMHFQHCPTSICIYKNKYSKIVLGKLF